MRSGSPLMRGIELHKTIDFIFIGRWGDIMPMLPNIQIRLLAKSKTLITITVLVLRVILILGRS